MHIVPQIKKYSHTQAANAMYRLDYYYYWTKNRPTNIECMVQGVPRCDLVKILAELKSPSKPIRYGLAAIRKPKK